MCVYAQELKGLVLGATYTETMNRFLFFLLSFEALKKSTVYFFFVVTSFMKHFLSSLLIF